MFGFFSFKKTLTLVYVFYHVSVLCSTWLPHPFFRFSYVVTFFDVPFFPPLKTSRPQSIICALVSAYFRLFERSFSGSPSAIPPADICLRCRFSLKNPFLKMPETDVFARDPGKQGSKAWILKYERV